MTPVTGPEAENKRQSQYAMLLLAIIAIALAASAITFQASYEHPTRAADCTAIQQYAATCSRAVAPPPTPPWGGIPLYLGTLAAAILAVLLVEAGWRASVTRQEAIVTAFANSANAQASSAAAGKAATPLAAPAPVASPPAAAPLAPARKSATAHPVAGEDPDALRRPAPTTIHANTLTPAMVKAPTAAPRSGVDPASVEAKK